MKFVLRLIAVIFFFLMFGAIGTVDRGGSLWNVLWAIPFGAVSFVTAVLGAR